MEPARAQPDQQVTELVPEDGGRAGEDHEPEGDAGGERPAGRHHQEEERAEEVEACAMALDAPSSVTSTSVDMVPVVCEAAWSARRRGCLARRGEATIPLCQYE